NFDIINLLNKKEDSGDVEGEYSDDEESEMLKPFSSQDLDEEIEKGRAAKAQLGLWDSFMEVRIKLQKALSTTNQIPQYDTFPPIRAVGGKDLNQAQNKAKGELKSLLDTLLDLQEILLVQNPESKHVIQGGKPQPTADDDDEEIPSDEEEIPSEDEDVQITKENDQEDVSSMEDDGTNVPPSKREKRKLQNYEEIVAKRHKNFHEFRNMTLQKWHDKTKIASGKINSK
ncbi:protein AATF-like, partial [Anneissia japonica]|uniref:protein AATF-like n=1 Tax=Anneissia japonica TaxID=1529436 RepID=UPI0014256C31